MTLRCPQTETWCYRVSDWLVKLSSRKPGSNGVFTQEQDNDKTTRRQQQDKCWTCAFIWCLSHQGPVSKWSLRQDLLLKLRHVNDTSSRFLSLSSTSCLKLHLETGPWSDMSGVKGIIGMHRFNICLVVVLSLSCSGVKARFAPYTTRRSKVLILLLFLFFYRPPPSYLVLYPLSSQSFNTSSMFCRYRHAYLDQLSHPKYRQHRRRQYGKWKNVCCRLLRTEAAYTRAHYSGTHTSQG